MQGILQRIFKIEEEEKENNKNSNDDISGFDLYNNKAEYFQLIKKNDNCCLFKKKENDNNYINTEEDKSEFYNIINEENDEKNNPLNLFRIIINDYINYPNYNLIETISNVENYISFVFNDYNQINLKYKFKEENIKDNSIELFGEQFTNNNKEKCFLLINEKIIELSRIIKLDQIFDSPGEKIIGQKN